MSISDLDNPEQQVIRGKVRLTDKRGFDILEKYFDVHVGPPIGDWVEFLGIRIALKRVRSDVFDGIVPDFMDVVRGMVTSDQSGAADARSTEVDNT